MTKREIADRQDGLYGVKENGKEVPELRFHTREEAGRKIRDLDDQERSQEQTKAAQEDQAQKAAQDGQQKVAAERPKPVKREV